MKAQVFITTAAILIAGSIAHELPAVADPQRLQVSNPAFASCASIEKRVDCGYVDISSSECEARGCCYEKQAGMPSCYFPAEGVDTKKVIMVVSNHFDAGYTLPVNEVVQLYHSIYFPLAADVGAALDANSSTKATLRWTTQSWLVDLFFNCPSGNGTAANVYNISCPSAKQKQTVKAAIDKGYITWHAFPHNGDLELATQAQLEFGVTMTHSLDDQLGQPRKTVVSQRDVPGFPRASLASLNAAGVDVLSEGSNTAMNPPNVPPVFLWHDNATGAEAIVEWHALGYGQLPKSQGGGNSGARDYLRVPGLDTVLLYAWKNDNQGPPASAQEVIGYFEEAQSMFPGAEVVAGTLEDFATLLRPYKESLIRVTGEIGDTWLMSAAADAKKLAQIRALQRAADECVECKPDDPAFTAFRKRQLKGFEHTLGLHRGGLGRLQTQGWSNAEFYAQRRGNDPDLQQNPASWARQHAWCIDAPLAELPAGHPLLARCQAELAALEPQPPSLQGFTRVSDLATRLSGLGPAGRISLAFDPRTAAVAELVDAGTGTTWVNATGGGNSSLGLVRYQTLTQQDWAAFRAAYIYTLTDQKWANETYGKPNMSSADPESLVVAPTMQQLWVKNGTTSSVAVLATFDAELHDKYGCPTHVWLTYDIASAPGNAALINLTVFAGSKASTRLSEAAWLTINPEPGASSVRVRREVRADFDDEAHGGHVHHDHQHLHHDHQHLHHDHQHLHHDHQHLHHDHQHLHHDHQHLHHDHLHGSGRRLHAEAPPAERGSPRWVEAQQAIEQARSDAVQATPAHLRDFYKPYHADAHSQWADLPAVRAAAGACEGCRLGRRQLLTHELDRDAALAGWSIRKLGEWQSPLDGVRYSGRSVQAATDGVLYAPASVNASLRVHSPDAPILRFGEPLSPFPLPMPDAPSENGGASFALFSNSLINTNVPFWQPWAPGVFEDDYSWRFEILLQ